MSPLGFNRSHAAASALLATFLALVCLSTTAFGQASSLHRFAAIHLNADRTVSLELTSAVPANVQNFYELFPIESSANLLDWTPLTTIVRTNRFGGTLAWTDRIAGASTRFYRTPTNQLSTPLPPPEGPFGVGVVARLLTDPSRTNRYVKTNSSFMVTVWYPAEPAAGAIPGPYLDAKLASDSTYTRGKTAVYTVARGHARPALPVASNQARYPIVIYSHGYNLTRTENTRKAENLASYGFVIIAIDHVDCYATVFPNGQILLGGQSPSPPSVGSELHHKLFDARMKDIQFLLGQISAWNADDPLFAGRLDKEQIGVFGFSFGGGVAAGICATDARCKAGLSLDGGAHTNMPQVQVPRPFFILAGGNDEASMQAFRQEFRALFDRMAKNAYWVRLKNSAHFDFNERPWFDAPTSLTLTRRALVQDRYVASFFRKYLRGEDDHFLDGMPADWAEVEQLLMK